MRIAASLVSLSLLALPALQLPVNAGSSVDHSQSAQQELVPQRQLTDYYPDDPLWKYLDTENKEVINHFGFHALYELMVYRRRLRRGAEAIGLVLSIPDQKENPIPDDDWFLLMNTSQVLNMLYPQELEELRRYGFDAFRIANIRATRIEDQLAKSLTNELNKNIFDNAYARNEEEEIDQLVDKFQLDGGLRENVDKFAEIVTRIQSSGLLSARSVGFMDFYLLKLSRTNQYDTYLEEANRLYGLASQKWGNSFFPRLPTIIRLIRSYVDAKSHSISGRGEYQNLLPTELMISVDDAIQTTEQWWGPFSFRLIYLLKIKADLLSQMNSHNNNSSASEVIKLLELAEKIYLYSKELALFPSDSKEKIADIVMGTVAMSLMSAEQDLGNHVGAVQRFVRYKAYPLHEDELDDSNISLGSLFVDLVNQGKYAQTIELIEELLALNDSGKIALHEDELFDLRLNLAFCYLYVGRFREFDDLYKRIGNKIPVLESMKLMSMFNRGMTPEIEYPLPPLNYSGEEFDFESAALEHMAAMLIESRKKDFMAAIDIGEPLYKAIVSNSSKIEPHNISSILSSIYFASNDKQHGEYYLRKTVDHISDVDNSMFLFDRIQHSSLMLSLVEEKMAEAKRNAEDIFSIWLSQLQVELARMPTRERTQFLQSVWALVNDSRALNLLLSSSSFTDKYPESPLFYVLNRKGLLEELEKRQRELINAGPSAQAIVQKLKVKQQLVADGEEDGEALNALQLEINALERKLYRVLPKLQPRTFSVQQVSQALPSDGALVEYVRYQWADPVDPLNKKERYAAFVLKPNERVSVVQLGNGEDIDSSIAVAIDSLEQQFSDSEVLLQKVFDRIFAPLRSGLAGVRVLYLSPDGELNRLPFAAASSDGGTTILADQVDLRIITTGRELLQLQEGTPTAMSPAVVVANPAFDRAGVAAAKQPPKGSGSSSNQDSPTSSGTQRAVGLDQIWAPLQYTQEEGQNTSDLLGGSLFTGDQATTANIKATRSPLVAHFATHGYFMPDEQRTQSNPLAVAPILPIKTQGSSAASNPLLRSGIVMAGANQPDAKPDDDGYLTALEVLQLDWEGTELVVVSACESGRGLVKRGEGMYGLKRAFAVAGARSSLLSLWKVDDQATAAFMQSFYQRLKEGKGKGDALAETQQEFRNHPIAGWRHPYVWAAFQLSGDWGPVKGL